MITSRRINIGILVIADLIISGMEVSSPLHILSSSSPQKESDSESPVPDENGRYINFRYNDIQKEEARNGELRHRQRHGETSSDLHIHRYDSVKEEEKVRYQHDWRDKL